MRLVLLPESEHERSQEIQNNALEKSDCRQLRILESAENHAVDGVAASSVSLGIGKAGCGGKRAVDLKKKYVPKLRAAT